MNVIFCGVWYYKGPAEHLDPIFAIFRSLGIVFEANGINVQYYVKPNDLIPPEKMITKGEFNEALKTCDLLFVWNGSLSTEREILKYCREHGIPYYCGELGWFPQSGTFYFDRKGVNCESTLIDWKYFEPITLKQQAFLDLGLSYYHDFSDKKGRTKETDFVFVPLQDESDSQIIVHSPRFKTMQALVDYVEKFIPGRIIVKKHPRCKEVEVKISPKNMLVETGTIHDFLPNAKYVVTINSTVGVEALAYHKPVITLGNTFYESRGLTYKVTNDEEMVKAVEWAEKGQVAAEVIESFLHYLITRQWYNSFLSDPNRIMTLIHDLTER
jgi:capsular polysaccharide export protein